VGGVAPPALAVTVGAALPPAAPLPPLPCAEGDFIFSFMVSSFYGQWLSNQLALVSEEYPPTTLTTSPTAAVSLRLC